MNPFKIILSHYVDAGGGGCSLFYNDKLLRDCVLGDILPYAQKRVNVVSCTTSEKVWFVTTLLNKYLESYADCIVVTVSGKFVGLIDGREWVKNLIKEPTREFFSLYSSEIMSPEQVLQVNVDTKLLHVLENWKKIRRAVAVIEDNNKSIYAPISLRNILEIISLSRTDMKVSDIHKKKIISINNHEKIIDVLSKMLQNKIRRLLVEETQKFISDRIVINNIINKFNFLRESDLHGKTVADFECEEIPKLSENMSLVELSRRLIIQKYPCVMYDDNIITPWDVIEKI